MIISISVAYFLFSRHISTEIGVASPRVAYKHGHRLQLPEQGAAYKHGCWRLQHPTAMINSMMFTFTVLLITHTWTYLYNHVNSVNGHSYPTTFYSMYKLMVSFLSVFWFLFWFFGLWSLPRPLISPIALPSPDYCLYPEFVFDFASGFKFVCLLFK